MPLERSPGMDNPYYDYSRITTRQPLRWPDGAHVALCVVVNAESFDLEPVPGPSGGRASGPYPDFANWSAREYGNRVGIYRVMEVLDKYGIRATVAMDAALSKNYPPLTQECLKRGWEFIGHGQAATRMISSRMTEDEERAYITSSLEALKQSTGSSPVGWHGPDYGESERTVALLAELGVKYVMDWPNDEQPYRMKVPQGQMVSVPLLLELDDAFALGQESLPVWRWSQSVREAFDTLYTDGATSGRLLALNLHPWLIGRPFRIGFLDEALAYICEHPGVWKATGKEIVDWYLESGTTGGQSG